MLGQLPPLPEEGLDEPPFPPVEAVPPFDPPCEPPDLPPELPPFPPDIVDLSIIGASCAWCWVDPLIMLAPIVAETLNVATCVRRMRDLVAHE